MEYKIKILRYIDKYIFWLLNICLFFVKNIWNNPPLPNPPPKGEGIEQERVEQKKNQNQKKLKKILVIRLWALWSSILTFPMIKQLKKHYWTSIEYSVLTTTRTIWIYKNQWYFDTYLNLFCLKDLIGLIFSFKKYDIVIDTEEYFNVSSLVSLWIWKINIWYDSIFTRKIVYNNPVNYDDKIHACLWFLNLLKPLWIEIKKTKKLESFKYTKNNAKNVDKFFYNIETRLIASLHYKKICFHTQWAETSKDRFWNEKNWIKLIDKLIDNKVVIFLSWTDFEKEWVLDILKRVKNKNVINICNEFSLWEFAYFLKKCDLVISNDTWPMHLSASMWTKTIWLFWPNLPSRFWAYPLDKNINIYKWDWKPSINVHKWNFRIDKNNFVNKISVDEVYEVIEESLGV